MSQQNGIVYHAEKCEEALRLAAFADAEMANCPGMAVGLRKLASYHADHAMAWAQAVQS